MTFDALSGLTPNPDMPRGEFAVPLDRAVLESSNYEQQIAELQEPLLRLAQQVSQWQADWQAGTLDPVHLPVIRPVLEALMLLPPQTRLDLGGSELETFYDSISHL